MQVVRFRGLSAIGLRNLYSASALGLDGFISTKEKIKNQFHELEERFKSKMKDFAVPDSKHMVFTEDLKHMIYLTEKSETDLELLKSMMTKFAKQNKDMRFGSFVFGPVVMRMYHHLDQPKEALEVFRSLESDGFFDQLITYQILMDLLLKHKMYLEVIEVFDVVQRKQLKGTKFPKNAVVLVLAACYKINNTASYNYAKELWTELNNVGHYPMRRAGTFAAALAVQQNEPHVALEILTSLKQQSYVTIRNLKISALADLGRPDDALPILRAALESDRPTEKKCTFCEEIINKIRDAIIKFDRVEVTEEYQKIEKQLRNGGHVLDVPLDDLLCSEISNAQSEQTNFSGNFKQRWQPSTRMSRPGLREMT